MSVTARDESWAVMTAVEEAVDLRRDGTLRGAEVGAYVDRRVAELTGRTAQSAPVDGKARAIGGDA